jgi:two-component system, chemotaxis family, protein-glutamate methylesterase/glutaminase
MIKLLLVDDSALMRKYLRTIFEDEGDFEIRTARNGRDALEQIAEFSPDVVTLDVNMPEMDGLTCLSHIMAEDPRSVVMVSSLTAEGAMVTLEALEIGAVDFVEKPDGTVSLNIGRIREALVQKVRAAAKARLRRARGLVRRMQTQREKEVERRPRRSSADPAHGLVMIGVSTGGPRVLEEILPRLPADLPWPVLVAQHMPAAFTGVFAQRMNGVSALQVVEAARPTPLKSGTVYIAQGDADVLVERRLGRLTAVPTKADPALLWHPSVERMVSSALESAPAEQLIGVMLTGMGNDGAAAMTELKRRGGRTIAESEESAVVFGMPGELVRMGGASVVLAGGEVAGQIVRWLT